MQDFRLRGYLSPDDFEGSDTEKIQQALDEAAKTKIGKVIISGDRIIEKTLILSEDIYLVLDHAFLKAKGNFPLMANSAYTKKKALAPFEESEFFLEGEGSLLSGDLIFYNCGNVTLEGINLCGTVSFSFAHEVRMENCKLESTRGISILRGCNNFILEHLFIKAGADGIAANAGAGAGETVIGKEEDIHDLIIKDCEILTDHEAIRLLASEENSLFNFQIDHIKAKGTVCVIGDEKAELDPARYFNLTVNENDSPNLEPVILHNATKNCLIG